MGNVKLAYLKKEPGVIPYSLVGNPMFYLTKHTIWPLYDSKPYWVCKYRINVQQFA